MSKAEPVEFGSKPEHDFETRDDRLVAVNDVIPEFAGTRADQERGQVTILMTDPEEKFSASERAERAHDALERVSSSLDPRYGEMEDHRIETVDFTFSELRGWYDEAIAGFNEGEISAVSFSGVDEANNRIYIGIIDESHRQKIESALDRTGVPDRARHVEVAEAELALRQEHRPLRGGTQIQFQSGFLGLSTGQCSSGFNALRNGTAGFLTNSHCTRTPGDDDNGRYWQPVRPALDTNQVGHLIADPAYFVGGLCPSGRECRFSDAAFVQLGVSGAQGTLPHTALGSTAWDGSSLLRVTSKGAFGPEGLYNRIGRSTGRRTGNTSFACFDFNDPDSSRTWLCQDLFGAFIDGGDSGGPVFRVTNDPIQNDLELMGIAMGWVTINGSRHTAFSPVPSIEQELGALGSVCAVGFGC